MRGTRAKIAAFSAAVMLAVAGCGSGGDSGGDATGSTGGEITARGGQPQNPLVPGDTGESNGHDIVELFSSALFRYDPKTTEPVKDLAESVDTTDNVKFTVKIKPDVKFHDGTTVKAKNFVDAWNYTAYGPNGQYLQYFMEPIKGYTDVADPKKPKAKTMSGLKVVDDTTFTIQTSEPVSNLPIRLGYTAFSPEPDAFFKDTKAFKAKPVGAGPYKVDNYTPNQSVTLSKFADYGGGAAKGNVDKITFKFYQSQDAAYSDLLAGNLDTIDTIPAAALIDKKYETDLNGRAVSEPYPAIQTLAVAPDKVDPSMANDKLRQAISMGIDRQKVIDDQFDGQREVATGWVAPGVEGYLAGACGDLCKYDPAKAKALFKESGYKGNRLTITYNADGDHKAWTTATCNSIKSSLGVDCVATPITDFAALRDKVKKGTLKGMWRSGWIADYPHIENFLTPLYSKGGSSNDNKYDSPEFDAMLKKAAAAKGEESLKIYQDAEKSLGAKMPAIPLWYYTATIGWSDKVTDVQISKASGRPDLLNIKMKG